MVSSPEPLPARLLAEFGVASMEFVRHSWQADVWRARLADGTDVAIKRHHAQASFSREVAAYFSLPKELHQRAPRLVASAPLDRVLVVTWLTGRLASESVDSAMPSVFAAAGAWCRTLSESAGIEKDEMPYADAIARRVDGCLERTRGLVPRSFVDGVRGALDPALYCDVRRTWAHRDFAPYNWIWEDARLTVFDFGQSRPDYWLWDLTRLVPQWRDRDELRTAFFAGFGRVLEPHEETQLRGLTVLDGIATVAWASEHDEPELLEIGQKRLRRALEA